MGVCYLVFRPDSLTYTVVKSLAFGGHSVDLWTADLEQGRRAADKSSRLLTLTPNVTVTRFGERTLPAVIERLIVQVHPRLMERSDVVVALTRRAGRVTIITAGDRRRPWRRILRLQWKELRTLACCLSRVDRIAYKDGFYQTDLFRFIKHRTVIGFDIHSQFLLDEASFSSIHALDWSPETSRPILVNFLGSQDPLIRKHILDSVRSFFTSRELGGGSSPKTMFWHEYSDASSGGVGPSDFLRVLSHSDFTLCPPGYSLITHRPMEALLRGSIPVLHENELDLYDIGLIDGVNCIAVPRDQWATTMYKLRDYGEDEVIRMRFEILAMHKDRISYPASSKRMRNNLGIEK
jgi:hypothetical protein